MKRFGMIRDNVDPDGINVEQYLKQLFAVTIELTKAIGRMFEQEHLRFIAMFTAGAAGVGGTKGAPHKYMKEIKEHCMVPK